MQVRLKIDAVFCGPMSVGTISVIYAVMKHAELGLRDAKDLVDRGVFEGEEILVPTPSRAHADALVAELESLPSAPRVSAEVVG